MTGHGGTPYVVVLAAGGLSVRVGYQVFDAGQLRRYRAAIDTTAGDKLDAVFAGLRKEGLAPVDVPALTGRPRGCPADHPRLHLLRLRGFTSTGRGRRARGCRPGTRWSRPAA